jgi:hypothetical protein
MFLLFRQMCSTLKYVPLINVDMSPVQKDSVPTLIKKDSKIWPIYKEIQSGAVAKLYMRKGFLVDEEMRKYFPIFEDAVSYTYMTLQLLHSEFPYA